MSSRHRRSSQQATLKQTSNLSPGAPIKVYICALLTARCVCHRAVRIGLPVMGSLLGVVVLASLLYVVCIRYPHNCCMRLLGRRMTTPVQPVLEEEQRQPRHSILMMYTNRLAQSLRPGSRRGSGQTGKREQGVEQEPLRAPVGAQAGARGSLRSRRGSSDPLVLELEEPAFAMQSQQPIVPTA